MQYLCSIESKNLGFDTKPTIIAKNIGKTAQVKKNL